MKELVEIANPKAFVTVYDDNSVEFRRVKRGKVLETFIPSRKDADQIYYALISADVENKLTKGKLLPKECVSVFPYKVFYRPFFKSEFSVTDRTGDNNIKFSIWMPPMIQVCIENKVLTFSVDAETREDLKPNELLHEYPLPNIHSGGGLCLGTAGRFEDSDDINKVCELSLVQLFGVPFSTEVHNSYLYTDLIKSYKKLKKLGKDESIKFWKGFEFKYSSISLKGYL